MTIIVFLIDTSASMNQRVYLGGRPTLLDVAKGAVETFVKVRQRHIESRVDRYMLLTFEEPPHNIKAGWKENIATFMNELKNLSCVGMTTMGAALKQAFDVLNINRMQSGIDTYGQGRSPFYLEPSVIVVITDGGKLSNTREVQEEFNLPMHSPIPGSELTREPFRWDQRLFSLVLRLTGTPAVEREGMVASDTSPIDAMCEVTGGRSYCITSQRVMHQCIESLVQKVQSGVVINFEKIGPDPPPVPEKTETDLGDPDSREKETEKDCIVTSDEDGNSRNGVRTNGSLQGLTNCPWHQCRRLIYVQRQSQKGGFAVGYWPIPESFWPETGATSLPARSAHPNVKFTCTSQEPMVIENLPFDKYELEPSPLTQYILARKQNTTCWQVFVMNSYKNSDVGHPFGYLKASTNLACVNLFVMPYNYPVLLPLLDELFKIHRCKPTNEWRTQWQNYLRTMPAYYAVPLRRALMRMAAPTTLAHTLIPESMDNSLSYSVMTYLKRLKVQAKVEFDRMCNEVSNKPQKGAQPSGVEGIRVVSRSQFKKDLITHPQLQDKFTSLRDQLNDYSSFMVGVLRSTRGQQCYKNAFDIPRRSLLDQVIRMRANFLQHSHAHTKTLDDDYVHSMPIAQMGNYQEYLKRQQPQLREIESAPVRQHMFGNPFKIDKRMMVDEADIDLVGGSTGQSGGSSGAGATSRQTTKRPSSEPMSPRLPSKRKPGPLPKDTVARRPTSPRPDSPLPVFPTFLNSGPSIPDGYLSSPGSSPPASPAPVEVEEDAAPCLPVRLVNGDLGERPVLLAKRTLSSSSRAPLALAGFPDVPGRPRSPSPPPPPTLQPPPLDTPPPLSPLRDNHPYVPTIYNNHISEMRISPPLANHVEHAEVIPNHLPYEPTTPAPPPPPPPPTAEELAQMRKNNLSVRDKIYQEIRRPGRNHVALFKHLQFIQGPLEMKQKIVKDAIRECGRFKRKALSDKLEQFLQTLSTNNLTNYPLNNHVTRSKSKNSLQSTRTS